MQPPRPTLDRLQVRHDCLREHRLSEQPAHEHRRVMQSNSTHGMRKVNSIMRENGVHNSEAGHVAAVIESKYVSADRFGCKPTAAPKVAPAIAAKMRPSRSLSSCLARAG